MTYFKVARISVLPLMLIAIVAFHPGTADAHSKHRSYNSSSETSTCGCESSSNEGQYSQNPGLYGSMYDIQSSSVDNSNYGNYDTSNNYDSGYYNDGYDNGYNYYDNSNYGDYSNNSNYYDSNNYDYGTNYYPNTDNYTDYNTSNNYSDYNDQQSQDPGLYGSMYSINF